MRVGTGIPGDVPRALALAAAAALLFNLPAAAQQITGTPGSPSATSSIDGKQLPPPPPKFGGVIKESATDSTPWWPSRIVPPKGAPNVLLIMTDDQGYGVSGTLAVLFRHRPWTASPRRDCATFSSTPLLFARRRGRRSSPDATTTRSGTALSANCPLATRAMTP